LIRSARRAADATALFGLLVIAVGLFRSHLVRATTFIGNSDRLNHFLHGVAYDIEHLRGGMGRAWDESMFMGFGYFGVIHFSSPLAYLEALLPVRNVTAMAGYGSCLVLVAAAWAAYLYIRQICDRSYCAFVGAALYALSSFATVKLSQNDNTFLILVLIPLMMTVLYRLSPANAALALPALAALLAMAVYFTSLQKVGYTAILLGAYAVFRSAATRSWVPVGVTAAAGALGGLASAPRLVTALEDFALLERVTPEVRHGDFGSLYAFQDIRPREVLRWLDDGIFGRYPGEAAQFHNNSNLAEGLLLYTSLFAALLIVAGVVRRRGRWLGLVRFVEPELSFHGYCLAVVMAFILVKPLVHLLWLAFGRVDFYHARFSVAALPSQSVLVSVLLAEWLPGADRRPGSVRGALRLAVGAGMALGILMLIDGAAQPHLVARLGFTQPVRIGRLGGAGGAIPTEVVRVILGGLVFAIVIAVRTAAARESGLRGMAAAGLGWLMVFQAFGAADFRLNGPHTRTTIPFDHGNSLTARPFEFGTPSPTAVAALRRRLETDRYRSVLVCPPAQFPAFCSAHLSQFWHLRLLEGYSVGVPTRLATFSWPDQVKSLRALSFPSPSQLTWPLLSMLNVKYAVTVNDALYRNVGPSGDGSGPGVTPELLEIRQSPVPVVPRQFFTASVVAVADLPEAVRWLDAHAIRSDVAATLRRTSVVEAYAGPTGFEAGGDVGGSYHGDHVTLSFEPATGARFLVVNEMYHRRWHAYADGRELRVYPVNGAMRGVVVPAGVDRVTMRFVPFLLTLRAAACGAVAVIVVLASAAWLAARGRRPA
jgi:hypothetical protein